MSPVKRLRKNKAIIAIIKLMRDNTMGSDKRDYFIDQIDSLGKI